MIGVTVGYPKIRTSIERGKAQGGGEWQLVG